MTRVLILPVLAALAQAAAPATTPQAAPPPRQVTLDVSLAGQYNRVKSLLTRTAERMPAEAYDYKPAPEVRTFSGNIVHAAATNFGMCANLTGTASPKDPKALEKTPAAKAAAVMLLAESFQFCDTFVTGLSLARLNDTYPATAIGPSGARSSIAVTKAGLLGNLIAHNSEMYGYMAVYLRLKGLVPPSSDAARPATAK